MGKVRIKQIGIPELEEVQKERAKRKREAKKLKKVRAPGLKGGERVVAVGPTEEELEKIEFEKEKKEPPKAPKQVKPVKGRRGRSKRYKNVAKLVDKTRFYPIKEAIALLRQVSLSRFNGTVEAHLNLKEKGLSGELLFPHGTGKKIKVAIANDKLLTQLKKGKVDFDVLVAHPRMMPKLAQFGRVLGPKGLMPNPKRGTVTQNPEKKAQELARGKIYYKTEKDSPIIHLIFGKMDFKDAQLIENFQALIKGVGSKNIKKAVIKSTISPGIKVDISQAA